MKTIGFIGAYDKTDLMIYLAKIMTVLNRKVLLVDSTITQKAKYTVPVINPTKTYITEFEEIDVAVGFETMEQIRQYIGTNDIKPLDYDVCLIDIDSINGFNGFAIKDANINYFVTAFDMYSLKKGLEIISELKEPITLNKVLFSKQMLKEEDEYLDFLSLGYKVIWGEHKIGFPLEVGDQSVIVENQLISRIKMKKLSEQYKEGLMYLVYDILKDVPENEIRKALKTIEKDG